jgi:hypothetical protein
LCISLTLKTKPLIFPKLDAFRHTRPVLYDYLNKKSRQKSFFLYGLFTSLMFYLKCMKKDKLLSVLVAVLITSFVSSQIAVNFNTNDCGGNNHILFNDLDAGKVVIITWVMPCGTCIGPALSAATEVQNFKNTYPGKFIHYFADDFANTSCTSIISWCSTNGITNYDAIFSSTDIKMLDYGSNGMPKTVVLAGVTHSVYFNENNTLTATSLTSALSAALNAANEVGIEEHSFENNLVNFSPNPTSEFVTINESKGTDCTVYDSLGKIVLKENIDNDKFQINISRLQNGLYYIKLSDGKSNKLVIKK